MATLSINLQYTYGVESAIKGAIRELDKRQSDYEGIIRDVNAVSSSSGNLSNCNVYLKKKNSSLQKKMNKLNGFKSKITRFSSNAKASDKRVANYITDKSESFYKAAGIKTGWAAVWDTIKKTCKEVWEAVKDFYEKHKYVIDLIVDVAMLVVAVVSLIAAIPTGGATLFFSCFAIAQSAADVFTSSVALGCHIAGDDEKAGKWAERGLKDWWKLNGKAADWVLGKLGIETNLFETLAGFTFDALNIASIFHGFAQSGKKILKAFKNKNVRKIKLRGIKTLFGIDLTPGASKKGYAAIKAAFGLKNQKQAFYLSRGCGWVKNIKTIVTSGATIFNGDFRNPKTGIGGDIKKIIKGVKDIKALVNIRFSF